MQGVQARKPKNIKQKQYCNKFNKDFKNDPHQIKSLKKKKKGKKESKSMAKSTFKI